MMASSSWTTVAVVVVAALLMMLRQSSAAPLPSVITCQADEEWLNEIDRLRSDVVSSVTLALARSSRLSALEIRAQLQLGIAQSKPTADAMALAPLLRVDRDHLLRLWRTFVARHRGEDHDDRTTMRSLLLLVSMNDGANVSQLLLDHLRPLDAFPLMETLKRLDSRGRLSELVLLLSSVSDSSLEQLASTVPDQCHVLRVVASMQLALASTTWSTFVHILPQIKDVDLVWSTATMMYDVHLRRRQSALPFIDAMLRHTARLMPDVAKRIGSRAEISLNCSLVLFYMLGEEACQRRQSSARLHLQSVLLYLNEVELDDTIALPDDPDAILFIIANMATLCVSLSPSDSPMLARWCSDGGRRPLAQLLHQQPMPPCWPSVAAHLLNLLELSLRLWTDELHRTLSMNLARLVLALVDQLPGSLVAAAGPKLMGLFLVVFATFPSLRRLTIAQRHRLVRRLINGGSVDFATDICPATYRFLLDEIVEVDDVGAGEGAAQPDDDLYAAAASDAIPPATNDDDHDIICTICQSGLGEKTRTILLECGHQFHQNCIDFCYQDHCPNCKRSMLSWSNQLLQLCSPTTLSS